MKCGHIPSSMQVNRWSFIFYGLWQIALLLIAYHHIKNGKPEIAALFAVAFLGYVIDFHGRCISWAILHRGSHD